MIGIVDVFVRIALAAAAPPTADCAACSAPAQPQIAAAPLVAAPAAAAQASAIVDQVQKFYANVQQVTAQFRQAVTNNTFGSTKSSDGTVYIMKPGKMRWEYLDKKADKVVVKKSFISNGTYLYVVEHDNMQIVKKNLQQDLMPVAVSFLYGKGDLKTEFNAEIDGSGKYGEKGEVVLKLTPKRPSAQYKNLILCVNPSDYRVTQSVIIDSSDNVNHFRFYAPDFKTAIKPTLFEFDERNAKGYRVVDADAPGGGLAPPPPPAPPAPAAKAGAAAK